MKKLLARLRERKETKANVALITDYLSGDLPTPEMERVRHRLQTDAAFRARVEPVIWAYNLGRGMKAAQNASVGLEEGWRGFRAAAMRLNPELAALLPAEMPSGPPVPYLWPEQPPPTIRERAAARWQRFLDFRATHRRLVKYSFWALCVGAEVAFLGNAFWPLYTGKPVIRWAVAAPEGFTATQAAMPDGVHAAIASRSTLRFQTRLDRVVDVEEHIYMITPHEAELDGEAFFEIPATRTRQLVVHAGEEKGEGMTVTSLDGSFDVDAYEGAKSWRVVVEKGHARVALAKHPEIRPVTLRAGEGVVVTESSIGPPRRVRGATTWRTGRLEYEQVLLGDVLDDLSNWFGLHFLWVPPRVRTETVTLTVNGSSPDEALRNIRAATGHLFDRWVWYVLFDY